jgi:Flp pilus assembly protein TadD
VHPQGVDALSGLAMLYLNQGKNPQARDRARVATELDTSNAEAWIVLGAALDALGARSEARDAYQKCASLPLEGDGARYVGECRRLLR